jgi:hypothetical protein
MKDLLLLFLFISTRAVGWCIVSFMLVWAVLVELDQGLAWWTALGVSLIGLSEFLMIKLNERGPSNGI